jgi:hypothetical protein
MPGEATPLGRGDARKLLTFRRAARRRELGFEIAGFETIPPLDLAEDRQALNAAGSLDPSAHWWIVLRSVR